MAQEAVRRDELANSFDVVKTWVQNAADQPLDLTVYPPFTSLVERVECKMMLQIWDASDTKDNTHLGIDPSYINSPIALYWRDGNVNVGMVASPGVRSYNTAATNMVSAGQPIDLITHFRDPKMIPVMNMSVVSPSVAAGSSPDFIKIVAAGVACSVRLMAHFTFFGPRDTRMYM